MNLCDIKNIKQIMAMFSLNFKKEFGQNFLTDCMVVEDIADMCCDYTAKTVLEIGPGIGSLTQELAKRYENVVAFEIDRGLIPVLKYTLGSYPNVKVINEDIMEAVRRHPGVRGVFHSYSGALEQAKELLTLGYMISFSGTISFTNARRPKEVAAILPKDSVLIETDCPYLAPHPKRGTLNHSGNLVYTNAALAAAWGISEEECAEITLENARRFFSL